jgi:membrane-associated phospholipid phosphatase
MYRSARCSSHRPSLVLSGAAFLILFIAVTLLAAGHLSDSINRSVVASIGRLWTPLFGTSWWLIGTLGSAEVTSLLFLIPVILLWRQGRWPVAIAFLTAFIGGNIIELALKHTLDHPGPPLLHQIPKLFLPDYFLLRRAAPRIVGNSYPSGHMFRTILLCSALVAAIPSRTMFIAATLPVLVVAWIILVDNVHWPDDVLGGGLLAGLLVSLALLVDSGGTRSSPA